MLLMVQVLLVVDNCPGHGHVDWVQKNLPSWVKYQCLPPNTTSVIQPMDGGIIRKFKQRYRRQLLLRMIDREYRSVDEFKKDLDLFQAIVLGLAAWREAEQEEIATVWRRTLLKGPVEEEPQDSRRGTPAGWCHILYTRYAPYMIDACLHRSSPHD
jgi:hypothetical protein